MQTRKWIFSIIIIFMCSSCKSESKSSAVVFTSRVELNEVSSIEVEGDFVMVKSGRYKMAMELYRIERSHVALESGLTLTGVVEFYSPDGDLLARRTISEKLVQNQTRLLLWDFALSQIGGKGRKLVKLSLKTDSRSFFQRYDKANIYIQKHTGPWFLD